MPNTSFVLLSLILSSLILHHRWLAWRFFFFASPLLALGISFPLTSASWDWGEDSEDVESLDRDSLLEMAERVERAIDRILPVSDARGADVGAGPLVAMSMDGESELRALARDCSPFRSPLGYGREGDEEAADDGERSSGVDDKVLVSVPNSSARLTALT